MSIVPHWSPDGKQIAFFGGPPDSPDRIYTVPFESGVVRQLTHGEASHRRRLLLLVARRVLPLHLGSWRTDGWDGDSTSLT